jgi:two-component system phosphate regulon sensor histidine kinase PhoR
LIRQRQLTILAVSFGAAFLLLLLTVALLVSVPKPAPAWIPAAICTVIAALAGFKIRDTLISTTQSLERGNLQREELAIELQQQRSDIDTFAEGLEIAIFICDEKGEVLYSNRKVSEMFNFPEPQGKTVLGVTLSYDLQNLVTACANSHTKQISELSFSYPQERVGYCEAWPQPEGRQVFLSIQDITELRRLERVRRDFVANVSHELRTPLATIRAMAETMSEDKAQLKEFAERYLPRIVSEVDRLTLISEDLLSLTTAESNPVHKQVCDIAEVFQNVVRQLEQKAQGKGLSLTYAGPKHITLEANISQITQVAFNLLDNAINYTNYGAVAVNVEEQESQVQIVVQDTGIGIASEHLPRIFERFYRVDKGRSRATGGTGLGLSIVKHIVESHGGQISVESSLNQGSKFVVTLPKGNIQSQSSS